MDKDGFSETALILDTLLHVLIWLVHRWSCLHLASYLGRRDLVELLMASGADPALTANNQVNGVYIAAQNGFPTTVQAHIQLGRSTPFCFS